jgi:hypothetical protein
MLEECNTKERRSVVRFCGQKDSIQRAFIKKCFLFRVGSVCCIKQFTAGLRNYPEDVRNSQMMKRGCGIGSDKSKDFYAAGFNALVKRWDKCINVGGGC